MYCITDNLVGLQRKTTRGLVTWWDVRPCAFNVGVPSPHSLDEEWNSGGLLHMNALVRIVIFECPTALDDRRRPITP